MTTDRESETQHRRLGAMVACYLAMALLIVPVFQHFPSPNEFSRWALTVSIVENGSVEVSSLLPLLGRGFEDLAIVGNRVYSNKAPGESLLAVIAYVAVRPFAGPPSADNMRTTLTAMRLLCSTAPMLLLFFVMLRTARRLGGSAADERFLFLVTALATPLLPMGLLLFSHALVASLLFTAWYLLFVADRREVANGVLAGLALGLAVSSDYPTAIGALILTLALAWQRRWPALFAVIVAATPFALFLGWYDLHCFGGILTPSYRFEKLPQYRDAATIGFPSIVTMARLLFDPNKGLFVFSPLLLAAFAGMRTLRSRLDRTAFHTAVALPAVILLTYSCYPNWHGGWTVGPRYIVSAIPFLILPLPLVRRGKVVLVLAGASIGAVVVTSFVFPFVPNDYPLPWGTFALPMLRDGLAVPNLFDFAGRGPAILFPFAMALLLVFLGLEWREGAMVTLGAALVIVVSLPFALRPTYRQAVERAYIEDVHFGRRGALDRVSPPGSRLRARRDAALLQPPLPLGR